MLSLDDMVAEKVNDIQAACRTLEDIGYNSLVVITVEQRHIEIGSERGRQFYQEHSDIIEKFVEFCQHDNKEQDQEMSDVHITDQKMPMIKVMPLEQDIVSYTEGVAPTIILTRDNLSSLGPYTVPKVKSEIHADESADMANENSESLNKFDNGDVKVIKTDDTSNSDQGQIVDKGNDDILDTLKIETNSDSDDADSELSALDDDISVGDSMYNTGTTVITVRQVNTGNIVKTEQNVLTKMEDDKPAVSDASQGKDSFKGYKKKRFPCDECDKTYARTENLMYHKRKHSGESPYSCGICRSSFRSNKMLNKHTCISLNSIRDVGKTKTKVCEVCGDAFRRQSELVVHKRKHSGEAPYECSDCGKQFRSQQYMRNHQKTHSNKGMFPCDQCDKKYARKEDLKVHQRKHSGNTPYTCDLCPKAFRSRAMLRAHLETHSEARFECDKCELSYATRANLARHKIVHSVAVPYICHQCGQGFKDPSSFKLHNLRHTGEKPHKCEICGRGFLKSTALRLHQRTHTERPHRCQHCVETFTTEEQLRYHQTLKHGIVSSPEANH